jgi:nucleoside-diphosphate kinase
VKEKTLLFFKPDLAESDREQEAEKDLEARLNATGLRVLQKKRVTPSKETVKEHYAEHEGKHFYGALVESVAGHEIVLFVVEGDGAVSKCREMMGKTDPLQAKPESFRAKWATDKTRNAIHGSASVEDAEKELRVWAPYFGERK